MIENVGPSKVYIDTNVFIYFVEFDNELYRSAKAWLADFEKKGVEIVASRLAFLE
jgi:predicted nucleic acid-binding protein